MLAVKDGACVLLLGLGLWVLDRAVQELRRVREELAQLRGAVQQQQLLSAARRGIGPLGVNASGADAVKRLSPGVCRQQPPVQALGARLGGSAQQRRGRGGRGPAGVPRPGWGSAGAMAYDPAVGAYVSASAESPLTEVEVPL